MESCSKYMCAYMTSSTSLSNSLLPRELSPWLHTRESKTLIKAHHPTHHRRLRVRLTVRRSRLCRSRNRRSQSERAATWLGRLCPHLLRPLSPYTTLHTFRHYTEILYSSIAVYVYVYTYYIHVYYIVQAVQTLCTCSSCQYAIRVYDTRTRVRARVKISDVIVIVLRTRSRNRITKKINHANIKQHTSNSPDGQTLKLPITAETSVIR